jgi:hypothetical protein
MVATLAFREAASDPFVFHMNAMRMHYKENNPGVS